MPKRKLSPEGEVIVRPGAALACAFQVLINCLEERRALSARMSFLLRSPFIWKWCEEAHRVT